MNGFERLSARQQKVIQALINQPTIRDAAKESGISETTVWRWLNEAEFQAAYRAARNSLLETTLTRLQGACGEAVTVLNEVMQDQTAPTSSRVTAAVKVLELTLKVRQELEIEERLKALEERLHPPQPE
ncbi:MAG TPA: phBC6A51 family helix-turn-helix protein, partial [Blastocatellia bacterium]|nr:phBC6A51 family helix-turn-helix protein [Blastocatellia bacterium]